MIPRPLRSLLEPHSDPDGYFRFGPIPEGTPINLLASVDPVANPTNFVTLCLKVKNSFTEINLKGVDSNEARKVLRDEVAPLLFKVSKCPDVIEDRGHYFGNDLPDADKRALIEFLKTL